MIIRQLSREDFRVQMDSSDEAWNYQVNEVEWHYDEVERTIEIVNDSSSIIWVNGENVEPKYCYSLDVTSFPVQFTLCIPVPE